MRTDQWPSCQKVAEKFSMRALSLALKPQLLLMDEPTSGVSIEEKFPVMDTLVGVLQESDMTIFVEHDMDVVQRYSQRVLVFDNGEVLADGTPDSVLANPAVRKAVWVRVVMLSVAGMRVTIKGFIIWWGSHSIFQPESALPW